jgi:hypothetical protein
MSTHELLSGEKLSLGGLTNEERTFLHRLASDAKRDADYFDLLRRVKGPEAFPLRGGPITPAIAASVLYRVAHDIADRNGIEQGYLLPPDVAKPVELKGGRDLLSLTEAAELIGITRPAAHQALVEERLRGQRVGNAWVVTRADAEAFRKARSNRTGDDERPDQPLRSVRAAAGARR